MNKMSVSPAGLPVRYCLLVLKGVKDKINVMIPNYLLGLDGEIKLFGTSEVLKKLHPGALSELKEYIHPSTYYYWLSGKTPISLKFLKRIVGSGDLWNELYQKTEEFSVGQKRCRLPKYMSNKLAYLIGCLHGDGSLNKNHKFITVTEESKEYLLEIVDRLFLDLFNVKGSILELNSGNYYRLEIGSKVVHSFLSMFCPVGKKKGKLRMPELILKDKELIKWYLSGLFDTDGCLPHIETGTKSIFFVFSQVDKNLVYDVYQSLLDLDIQVNKPLMWLSTNSPRDRRRHLKQYRIYIGSKKILKQFLSIIPFCHPFKKIRAKMLLEKLNGPGEI